MVTETNKSSGEVNIVLTDKNGNVKSNIIVKNMIVTTGKNFIAASMLKTTTNTPAAMSHMGIGSGTTAPVMSNTTLENEFSGGSNTRASITGSVNNAVTTYTASFGAGNGTGSVTEAAIFNSLTSGTMLCRTVFPVVTKEAGDTLTINWNITQS